MGQQKQDNTVKRYYWLKLKEDFFNDKEVKKLRRIAGGDTYTVIYLKLMLLSLKSDGRLYFDGIEDSFHEELALEIDEEPENVKVTLMYLEKMGLLQVKDEDEIYLTQMDNLIGSESESAKRVRECRARKKQLESGTKEEKLIETSMNTEDNQNQQEGLPLHCNNDVTECNADETKCNTEIDIDIYKDIYKEIDKKEKNKKEKEPKHKYGEYSHVTLTDSQYEKLCKEYGEKAVIAGIDNVDRYCQKTGKTYKDYNLVLRDWGIKTPKLSNPVKSTVQKPKEDEPSEEWTSKFKDV